ncbi:MAG: hypothetical protein PSV46_19285 [Reyranella sp.]|nr:hypothetical protein [Reyranella sp.]
MLLDALFKQLELQSGKVTEDERRQLSVELNGERIEFQLRYKQKQTKRPLTVDEKRWSWNANRDSAKELQATDRLVFAIKTYLPDDLRTEWLESDKATMEQMLPTIVAAVMAEGPILAERTRQHKRGRKAASDCRTQTS